MPDLVFCEFVTTDPAVASPGELLLRPRDPAHHNCRTLASFVLERGHEALIGGDAPVEKIERIVVQSDPTLDDMLAAMFVQRKLAALLVQPKQADDSLPSAASSLAKYAEMIRKGWHPVIHVRLERSLEAIYLAVRHAAGQDLNDAQNRDTFLAGWQRISERLLKAANADPFTESLFDDHEVFASEHAALAEDREVFRQDVIRGETWRISMPGGAANSLALLLRFPKSILYKQRSRQPLKHRHQPDADHVLPEPALLLVVLDDDRYPWVISTNPAHQLSLKPLAEKLQAAEVELDAERAARDPWFDGAPFQHTLIASPSHGLLPEKRLLGIVKHWAKAKPFKLKLPIPPGPVAPGRRLLAAAAVVLLVALLATPGVRKILFPSPDVLGNHLSTIVSLFSTGGGGSLDGGMCRDLGKRTGWQLHTNEDGSDDAIGDIPVKNHALLLPIGAYKNWNPLITPVNDATSIKEVLDDIYKFDDVDLVADATAEKIVAAMYRQIDRKFGPDDQLLIYVAGHGDTMQLGEGFLVGSDSQDKSTDKFRMTSLPFSRFRDLVGRIKCNHLFVVLDTCYAGRCFSNGATRSDTPEVPSDQSLAGKARTAIVYRKLEHCCRYYLTSCGANDTAPDQIPDGDHSPFAELFLKSLKSGTDQFGIVSSLKIINDVSGLRPVPCYGPLGGHQEGEFLFISKSK